MSTCKQISVGSWLRPSEIEHASKQLLAYLAKETQDPSVTELIVEGTRQLKLVEVFLMGAIQFEVHGLHCSDEEHIILVGAANQQVTIRRRPTMTLEVLARQGVKQ